MKVLRGKAALVTGAASGIGRAIALNLARQGVRVFMIDIDAAGLDAVAAEVRQLGAQAATRVCDVADPNQNSEAVRDLLGQWSGVDILVNNAGLTYYGCTAQMSPDNWNRLLAVNLHAPIQFTRELLPTLLRYGDGHVVNVASICGLIGLARVAAYSTTKFGLVGFSESLRHECGRLGLGVTVLCPGLVDTKLFTSALRGWDRTGPKLPPPWTLITPDAVARRALRAIRRDQHLVIMQPMSRLLYSAKRFVPGLLDLAHRVRRRRQTPAASAGLAEAAPPVAIPAAA